MNIKQEYLDCNIQSIHTNQKILVRFIPVELYGDYINSGYNFLFEEEEEKEEQE